VEKRYSSFYSFITKCIATCILLCGVSILSFAQTSPGNTNLTKRPPLPLNHSVLPMPLNGECATAATSTAFEQITNVTFNTINNNSTTEAGGYKDYTGTISTTVTKGTTYNLSLTYAGGGAWDHLYVWIDYNEDNTFQAGEIVVNSSAVGVGPTTVPITIPAGATTGNAVMRVTYYDAGGGGGTHFPTAAGCGTYDYGETEDYYLNIQPCAAAPTVQATAITFSTVNTTQLTLNCTNGNGTNRIIVASTAAIAATPTNGTTYVASATYGAGNTIGASQYVVYNGAGSGVTVTGLTAGTTYYFQVFEYNCTNYFTSTAAGNPANTTTMFAPCTATSTSDGFEYISNVALTGYLGANIANPTGTSHYTDYTLTKSATLLTGNAYTLNVTNGSGYATDGCDVWIDWNHDGVFSAGIETITYLAPSGPGTGGSAGPYAITINVPAGATLGDCRMRIAISDKHTSTGYTQISAAGCSPGFAYGEVEDYNIHVAPGCNGPTAQATAIAFSAVGCNQMTLGWTDGAGTGTNRIVLASTAAIVATPTNGTVYAAGAGVYAAGTAIGASYVVYDGTGTSGTVTGLTAGLTYYFQVFEYNCPGTGNVYYTPAAAGNPASQTAGAAPTTQATAINFTAVGCTNMTINWTNGNGADRILVASTAAIAATPTNGSNYAANANYSTLGSTIGASQYVIYNGTGSSVTMTGLTAGVTYYFQVFEYNCPAAGGYSYMTAGAAGNPASQATGTTVTAPYAGPDQYICGTATTLAATNPAIGTGAWTILNPTGSPASITTPASNTSTVTAIPATSYVTLRWTVSGGGCASASDDIVIYTQ